MDFNITKSPYDTKYRKGFIIYPNNLLLETKHFGWWARQKTKLILYGLTRLFPQYNAINARFQVG